MGRVVATLIAAVALALTVGAASVSGQAGCSFVRGFGTLRDLVGAQKVGACLEDEHFNDENGNAEQRTAGGLMVWRKADNFTAFTDGGTTWVNGPNGLESRPNNERFSWERDPVVAARSSPATAPTTTPSPVTSPAPASQGTGAESTGDGTTLGSDASQSAARAAAQAGPTAVSTPTRPPASTANPAVTLAATPVATQVSPAAGAAPSSAAQAATPAVTATKAATPTATQSAVQAKFRDKPDRADTGNDARFVVETNARKGKCSLVITYRRSDPVGVGEEDIDDDGRCELKFTLAADARTGKATAKAYVTANGTTVTVEDSFDVRKGDTAYAGDIEIEIEPDDLPDRVSVGQQFDISIDTNLKNRGECVVVVTWPKVGQEGGATKTPGGDGRCSWKMTVPATITKDGTATLLVVVSRNKKSLRTLTKEFEVKK